MLKVRNKYKDKVFHCINDLDEKTLNIIKEKHSDIINKYFVEV